jgi:hypothetical protein
MMRGMWGRLGRAGAVYAALGVLWWASVELVYKGVGCEEWPCLYPMVGGQLAITGSVLVGAGYALRVTRVAPARRTALLAAGLFVSFRLGYLFVSDWPGWVPHSVATAAQFGAAGVVAAFTTDKQVRARYRAVALGATAAVVPLVFAWTVLTGTR